MVAYGIGLDIGITSVGWATVAIGNDDKPFGIIRMGSRIFDAAEQPKTGASLAAPRREARSARRRLRRHRHRNERIRALLIQSQIITEEQLAHLFEGRLSDIYALRVQALDAPVTGEELARILIHIAQRRGFRSNRKNATSKEDGELLAAVNANKARMAQSGYRTVGEMLLKDPTYQERRRNKGGQYISTVSREMVTEEVHQIFASQRRFGAAHCDEDTEVAYLEILLSQRSFDDGPGANSPYAGNQIERMIGKCFFEPDEPRAAKATYSFEYFSLLEAINHLRIVERRANAPLTPEQRRILIDLAHQTAELNFAKIRKALKLPDGQTFNMVTYGKDETVADAEKKAKFSYLRAYHQMRTAFNKLSKDHFALITPEQRNIIGDVLSRYKTSARIRPLLKEAGLTEEEIDAAESLSFSKFGHISVKACDRIIPFLADGMNYSDACTAAGYQFKGHDGQDRTTLLPALDEDAKNTITSPVVLRAVSQTIKVVNAIIRERGCSPTYINIELAREMAKDFQERSKIKKEQEQNQAKNDRLMQRIREEYNNPAPTGLDLVKLKLFEEQGGVCAYSLKQMSLEHLFDSDYAEVDHIIPYSISFDDGYKNKVLVLSKENRDKGNRLPLQYLTGKRRDDFIVWVNNSVRDPKKRQRLLKERITEEDEAQFIERNLQDTKTASRFLLNYLNDHLAFAPFSTDRKKHVTAVNGSVTSYLRKRWGIAKVRANGDLHHAVDALVIACATDGLIQEVGRYAKYRESRFMPEAADRFLVDHDTGEIIKEFPYPWPLFRQELEARLSSDPARVMRDQRFPVCLEDDVSFRPLFVSRMPRHKVTGAAHKETVKSPKALDSGLLVVKKPLTELKLDRDGEIANYYMPQSDRLLYEALKDRLRMFGGDGKKAFTGEFRKPKSDGSPGPVVNKVKICEPSTLNVPVHGGKGAADNDSMVRIDVFHVEGDGYYFVPIYVADTLKPKLPNKACVAFKAYDDWKEMRDEDFIFSLYPNDLIKVTHRRLLKLTKAQKDSDLPESYETRSEMLYFVSAGISGATLTCRNHDSSYKIDSMGIKTLEAMEKYTVDVLGDYYPVRKETRQAFPGK